MKILVRKIIFLTSIFFILVRIAFGQGLNNIWLLGYGSNGRTLMNFDSVSVITQYITNVSLNMSFLESFAGISNKSGKLLLYTNGVKINNFTNQTMVNGSGLNPGPYTSSFQNTGLTICGGQIVIPFPNDTNKYYLFHETIDVNGNTTQPFSLFYSVIDMALDSGRGAVTQKNIPVIDNDTLIIGGITACKHANGRDWWIIVHQYNTNLFYTLLVTPGGVTLPFSQLIGGVFYSDGGGQTCISPNGKRYAHFHPQSGLDVYDFDRCSGTFSNWQHCDSITDYGGVAFSPNSNVLYVSATKNLYQFNLANTSQTLQQRKYLIAQWDTFYSPNPPFATTYYLQALAPDGKIYINSNNSTNRLHIIDYPDSLGLACNFIQHGFLIPSLNGSTIPNYPNYFLGADSGSVCDTLMLSNFQNSKPISKTASITISPNPAENYFDINIRSSLANGAQIVLYNAMGKEVKRTNLNENVKTLKVNTSDFQNGIYFYVFKNQSGKIVIQK